MIGFAVATALCCRFIKNAPAEWRGYSGKLRVKNQARRLFHIIINATKGGGVP
jgi:hypothetical protein